jgi:ribosomal protein S18 acetylase RimI-like enzyme
MRVEESAWPSEIRASRDQFSERFQVYPDGLWVAEIEGDLIGVLSSQQIYYQIGEAPSGWETTTNHGSIRDTHRPAGNALYVVSLGVVPEWQGKGIGSSLIRTAQEHAKARQLRYILLDSRLPGYKLSHEKGIPVEAYVFDWNQGGEPIDPELRFYYRLGFKVLSPSQIIPLCMTHDQESASYGVRMVWSAMSLS